MCPNWPPYRGGHHQSVELGRTQSDAKLEGALASVLPLYPPCAGFIDNNKGLSDQPKATE